MQNTNAQNANDEDIVFVKETLDGQTESFARLVDKYKNSIFNLAYRMTGGYSDAEDISQEAFLQAFKKLKKFNPDFKFHTWLYTIALNICRNKLRKDKVLRFIGFDRLAGSEKEETVRNISDEENTPEEIAMRKEEERRVNEIINALPPKYRGVFILRYAENMSYEEISKITGLPMGTVETNLFRARKILMKILDFKKK